MFTLGLLVGLSLCGLAKLAVHLIEKKVSSSISAPVQGGTSSTPPSTPAA